MGVGGKYSVKLEIKPSLMRLFGKICKNHYNIDAAEVKIKYLGLY